jgi:Fe2+ transport system protein FeoA
MIIEQEPREISSHRRYSSHSRPLSFYHDGDTVIITAIQGGRGLVKRLKEMGIGIGTTVTIVKNHRPGGLVLEVLDSKLCIGRGVAHKIRAEESTW